MNIQIELRGTSPLLLHNIALSDPENEWAKQLSKLSTKKKKTEEDHREMEKLQWYGGLYLDPYIKGVVMPTRCIRKAFISGARARKLGKHVERGLSFAEWNVPIIHDGSSNIDELFSNKKYHSRESVKINNSRIMRVRPQFPIWTLTATANLNTDIMDLDELVAVAKYTGSIEGLCDNRVNGYGRFEAKINVLATV